jgi:hypothetical protein
LGLDVVVQLLGRWTMEGLQLRSAQKKLCETSSQQTSPTLWYTLITPATWEV